MELPCQAKLRRHRKPSGSFELPFLESYHQAIRKSKNVLQSAQACSVGTLLSSRYFPRRDTRHLQMKLPWYTQNGTKKADVLTSSKGQIPPLGDTFVHDSKCHNIRLLIKLSVGCYLSLKKIVSYSCVIVNKKMKYFSRM